MTGTETGSVKYVMGKLPAISSCARLCRRQDSVRLFSSGHGVNIPVLVAPLI